MLVSVPIIYRNFLHTHRLWSLSDARPLNEHSFPFVILPAQSYDAENRVLTSGMVDEH